MANYNAAKRAFLNAIELQHQESVSKIDLANASNGLGITYIMSNHLVDAETALLSSITIFLQQHDKEGVTRASGNLSTVYRKMEKFDDALTYQTICHERFISTGNQVGLFKSYGLLGNLYAAKEDYDQALHAYLQFYNMS